MDNENEIKMILLGDCGVGKTNIISRYLKNEFTEGEVSTTGANYAMKKLNINGANFQVNIWDTAGQERYRSVTKMFLQDSQILLLCYSITDRKSFEHLNYWYNLATEISGNNITLGVAANKSDLFEKEQVKDSEGEQYAKNHNGIFKLISAKVSKESVDTLFELLIKKYIDKQNGIETNEGNSVTLKQKNTIKKDKKKCC